MVVKNLVAQKAISFFKPLSSKELLLVSKLRCYKRNTTLLLRGLTPEVSKHLLIAAWFCGLRVAIIRPDISVTQLEIVKLQLGNCVEFSGVEGEEVLHFEDSSRQSLCEAVTQESHSPLAPHNWTEDECALILFTSGSTGAPKGVCHSLGNIVRSVELFCNHFMIKTTQTIFCLAPIHSMSGLRSLLIPYINGANLIFSCQTNFLELLQQIKNNSPDQIICGPVFIKQLVAYGHRIKEYIKAVQEIYCTGADLNLEEQKTVMFLFSISVLNYYGLTETSGLVLAEKCSHQTLGYLPDPCESVALDLNEKHKNSDLYYLTIKSPNLFLGYLGEQLKRKERFNTGDLVKKVKGNKLKLVGRASGAIKASNTEFIFPAILEKWLKNKIVKADFHVTPITTTSGAGLSVYWQSSSMLDQVKLNQEIEGILGVEYVPVSWAPAVVSRNSLGKLTEVICQNN